MSAAPASAPAVLLDCDPGHDDALAILLAGTTTELVGITAVSGNAPLQRTLHNALIVTQIAGLDVPVHAGAERPLVGEPRHAAFIHGESGLDGPTLPPLRREAAGSGTHSAVHFLLEAAEARDDLWLVATGPLTNVALALGQEPALATRLRGISVMGGSYGPGNVTAAAEFNIYADPEAAAVVFGSGAHIVMAGLDLTHRLVVGAGRREAVAALGNAPAAFSAELLEAYGAAYARTFGREVGAPLHDPCAVLAVTRPELFEGEERHVAVELRGEHTRGMTVVDRRPGAGAGGRGEAPNAHVLTGIDDEAAFDALLQALTAYG
ncbi:MAG TPA: nucleoside hydrolase [Trueperaceae bacterium]|nr:nucleoside hydrolase [Trueperaceae bacterium]